VLVWLITVGGCCGYCAGGDRQEQHAVSLIPVSATRLTQLTDT
jgi:hypothetical protein